MGFLERTDLRDISSRIPMCWPLSHCTLPPCMWAVPATCFEPSEHGKGDRMFAIVQMHSTRVAVSPRALPFCTYLSNLTWKKQVSTNPPATREAMWGGLLADPVLESLVTDEPWWIPRSHLWDPKQPLSRARPRVSHRRQEEVIHVHRCGPLCAWNHRKPVQPLQKPLTETWLWPLFFTDVNVDNGRFRDFQSDIIRIWMS